MNCRVCAGSTQGAWPRRHKGTHCRDCHESWTSKTAAHAMCCHRTFSSNTAADAHLIRGKCTDPATIPAFELLTRANGNQYWTPTSGVGSHENSDEPHAAEELHPEWTT